MRGRGVWRLPEESHPCGVVCAGMLLFPLFIVVEECELLVLDGQRPGFPEVLTAERRREGSLLSRSQSRYVILLLLGRGPDAWSPHIPSPELRFPPKVQIRLIVDSQFPPLVEKPAVLRSRRGYRDKSRLPVLTVHVQHALICL